MTDNKILVALLKDVSDFAILQNENWYRIPVNRTPREWPPDYMAFYQPGAFKADAFRIRYYGKVTGYEQVKYRDLFPNKIESAKSERLYHRITIQNLIKLPRPIPLRVPRKIVFFPTTWHKFFHAEDLNDLYDESPLEDLLWDELNRRNIPAERQWPVEMGTFDYHLDFAVFCNDSKIDVETDGDSWHSRPERIAHDNQRNNDVTARGWHVLRFNTKQIQEQCAEYCLPRIQETINQLGGLKSDGLVPRKFGKKGENTQQLSMFEEQAPYETNTSEIAEDDDW